MTAGIVVFSCLVVLALFVHVSRRSDVLEDVVVVPTSGIAAVAPLTQRTTTYPLSRTVVSHVGDVSLRLSVAGGGVSHSAITVRIFSAGKTLLATCRYARGSLRDTNQMRCPVRNLALVSRVRITLDPKTEGLGVIGSSAGVGSLLVPRSHTLRGRLETVLGRIGAKHPAPFTGWLVPILTVLWLSSLLFVSVWIFRSPRDDE